MNGNESKIMHYSGMCVAYGFIFHLFLPYVFVQSEIACVAVSLCGGEILMLMFPILPKNYLKNSTRVLIDKNIYIHVCSRPRRFEILDAYTHTQRNP